MAMTTDPLPAPAAGFVPGWLASVVRLTGFGLVASAEGYVIATLGEALDPVNHLSYFTVLSNLFAAVVFAVGLVRPVPDAIRGAAATYLVTTGVVYAVLLRDVDVQTAAYANLALHLLMPIAVALDWVLCPPARPLRLSVAASWLVFPVVYLAYTLVRGPFAGWYPYPFLDPQLAGGYGPVALTCAVVAIGIAVFAAATWSIGNWLRGRLSTKGSRSRPRPAA